MAVVTVNTKTVMSGERTYLNFPDVDGFRQNPG